ncbi:RNA-guided endonuclease TnpB family protein [Sulfobacillus thermotolerans]
MAIAMKTLILPLLDANPGKLEALESTEALFSQMVQFYLNILLTTPLFWDTVVKVDPATGEILSERAPTSKDILTRLEFATVSTPAHTHPSYPLSNVPGAEDAPVVFRRAAINRAIGIAKSYRANRKRWESLPEHRRGKAPAIPTVRSMPVTLYQGMGLLVREETRSFLRVKVWDGQSWRFEGYPVAIAPYQRTMLAIAETEQARLDAVRAEARMIKKAGRDEEAQTLLATEGRQQDGIPVMESGTLFHDGKRWRFHVPLATPIRVKRAKDQLAENPDLPVTTVDLGVNNLAVAVAFHGAKVKGTLFVPGRPHEQRRFRRLQAIAVRQRKTGGRPKRQANHRIWEHLKHREDAIAHQVARQIVDFAKRHGSRVIVFEALSRMKNPKRTGWMKRQNLRRSYWMRGKIMRWVRHMALHEGILVVTRDAQFTSQACPRCGHLGARFCEATRHHRRGKDVFRCYACGWGGNADLVGALNLRKKWLKIFPSIATLRHEQQIREAQGKVTTRRKNRNVKATKTGPNRTVA